MTVVVIVAVVVDVVVDVVDVVVVVVVFVFVLVVVDVIVVIVAVVIVFVVIIFVIENERRASGMASLFLILSRAADPKETMIDSRVCTAKEILICTKPSCKSNSIWPCLLEYDWGSESVIPIPHRQMEILPCVL